MVRMSAKYGIFGDMNRDSRATDVLLFIYKVTHLQSRTQDSFNFLHSEKNSKPSSNIDTSN